MLHGPRGGPSQRPAGPGEAKAHPAAVAWIATASDESPRLEAPDAGGDGARIEVEHPGELAHRHARELADAPEHEALLGRDAERPLHLRGDALERVIQLPQPLEEIERLTQPMHVAKAYHSVIGYPTIATGSPAAGHHELFEMFRRRSAGSVGMEIAQAGYRRIDACVF